ncbi:PQQ-dependent sugar dehydrogenase [Massilia sp. R2A-15]|uniref:PQQ-dependent sugar dehydrogenase n=1 Tax=Massilia sp. R2A-15 TaxID=3064278 RepID=UPI002733B3EF|nr:PQQ-dependent sugar dehydrogenase [Massilia sp. R2A-15]WLI89591.1 PQQ-dependent sugar dehydrogenase [Massilia sp. R2A-15]
MLVDRARMMVLILLVSLSACGGGGGGAGVTGPDAPPLPAPTPTPLALSLSTFVSGLDNPIFMVSPPGDQRQFIVERPGRIRIRQNGAVLAVPFLDISARVAVAGEGGLLSMAFDPQFATNGRYYVYYTDAATDIVVERRNVSGNPNLSDPTSALEILRIPHPNFTNHVGGLLAFGPDGYLYLGTGDGGGSGDPPRNAQNLGSALGKLLRIDVSAATAGAPYAIPASNPFAGQAGRRGEIWAYGLRNPWRFAFDAGRLYIADVGQGLREEVDINAASLAGLNYGWNIFEGAICYNASTCNSAGLTAPAFDYGHDAGACSIIGGYVYRGKAIPELSGRYFYSDYCAGFLKSVLYSSAGVSEQTEWSVAKIGNVVSFGTDADGELYVIGANGTIYKIVRAGG